MKIPNTFLDTRILLISLARIVSEDSQLKALASLAASKSSKDS